MRCVKAGFDLLYRTFLVYYYCTDDVAYVFTVETSNKTLVVCGANSKGMGSWRVSIKNFCLFSR